MKILHLISLFGLAFAGNMHAAVIANYTFGTDLGSTDTELNTTASNFSWSYVSGAAHNVGSNVFVRGNVTPADQDTAISQPSYFSFTLTPNGGSTLNLTSLTFDTLFNTTTGLTGSTTATYFVRSSIDDFVANIGSSFVQNSVNDGSTTSTVSRIVDLTTLTGINSATEFRFYIFDGSTSSSRTVRLDNVVLNATVIPEPSVALLGGIGILALLRRRR